jgi:hypothetical protein
MAAKYVALITAVPGEGIRLEPTADAGIPDLPNEVNLLAMSVALALGRAEYEHHPEPRDPAVQTLDALLAGDAVMPWQARSTGPAEAHYVTCERTESGTWLCRVDVTVPNTEDL